VPRIPSPAVLLLCVLSAVVYFLPPPAEATATTMHAAALILLTAGLWALAALPEHVTALVFFLLAVVLGVAAPPVIFSGFASATMWLVLGGLFVAEAVRVTGLGRRCAGVLFGRFTQTYFGLLAEVAVAATLLAVFMPATVGRILLLVPIVAALAERVGFRHGSNGYIGLCLTAIMISYQSGSGILPANAPNLVLAGAAEAMYGFHFIYAQWLWVMFPVLCLVKGIIVVYLVEWLFPDHMDSQVDVEALAPMSADERRLAWILAISVVLWATDFIHGIRAGWIALAAAVACLLPRLGMLSRDAFNDVRFGSFFYVGAAIGVGAVANESGLGKLLGRLVESSLDIQRGADFANFMLMTLFATGVGLVTTNPAQPAVVAPLAAQFAESAGWPLHTALMTAAVGFTVMVLPYQVPPVVVGMHVASIGLRTMLRLALPLLAISVVILLPLDYLWWKLIGYFH
jgi:anion transporter